MVGEMASIQDLFRNIKQDVDDEEDDTELHRAAREGNSELLKHLLEDESNRSKINNRKPYLMETPLREAVKGGNSECVKLLISSGANIELEDIKGQTPLFVACSNGLIEIMEILLHFGANPDGSKLNKCTPLMNAVRDGRAEAVKLLRKHGVSMEPFNQINNTSVPGWPLQHSIVYRHFSCILALIQGGASVSLSNLPFPVLPQTKAKLSIPHSIVKYAPDNPEFVVLFYEAGGDLSQVDKEGRSAGDLGGDCLSLNRTKQLTGTPLSLKSICRNQIRQILGTPRLNQIDNLNIPTILHKFLKFQEFERYALRTQQNTHTRITSDLCD